MEHKGYPLSVRMRLLLPTFLTHDCVPWICSWTNSFLNITKAECNLVIGDTGSPVTLSEREGAKQTQTKINNKREGLNLDNCVFWAQDSCLPWYTIGIEVGEVKIFIDLIKHPFSFGQTIYTVKESFDVFQRIGVTCSKTTSVSAHHGHFDDSSQLC